MDLLGNCNDSICQNIVVSLLSPSSSCCNHRVDSLIVNPCQGSFSYSTNNDTLFITNTSPFASVSYDFGDGTISINQNPFHVYQQSGTYRVCQMVDNDGCSSISCDSIPIVVAPKCNAGFSYSFSGDTTYFQSTATSANNFIYRFGDGAISTDKNPFHDYQSSGVYVVEHEIFNDTTFCSDLFIDTIQVTVSFSCKAEFIPALDTSQSGVLFLVNTSSNDNSHNYLWDFGDGNSLTSRIPTHQFAENKAYKICLTVSDSLQNCISTFCDSIGLDSTGNILKSDGFSLKIIEGAALSIGGNTPIESIVTIFPNPFQSRFTIERLTANGDIFYELYSSQGKLILEGKMQNVIQNLYLDHLKNGLYILRIQKEEQSSSFKLIKQ